MFIRLLAEREQVWAEQMERVLARNGHMWNGEIYTLEDMFVPAPDQVILGMSTCEYKDLVFGFLKGHTYIAGKYGEDYLPRFTGVSCVPLTKDGKFVFGIRADRPEQGDPPLEVLAGRSIKMKWKSILLRISARACSGRSMKRRRWNAPWRICAFWACLLHLTRITSGSPFACRSTQRM